LSDPTTAVARHQRVFAARVAAFADPVSLAADVVFAPDRLSDGTAVLFCVPGASYSRRYYDYPDGFGGRGRSYSFAEHAARAGHVVLVVDTLGSGESSQPAEHEQVTLGAIAAVHAAVASDVRAAVEAGSLAPGLGPIEARAPFVGIGHSFGGCVTTLQQAGHASFDGIAVLGFPYAGIAGIYEARENEASLTDAQRFEWAVEHIPPKAWGIPWAEVDPYFLPPRDPLLDLFYGRTVPTEIVHADAAHATRCPRTALIEICIPRISAAAAAAVRVPVFLAFGAIDTSPDPHAEVQGYKSADDVTLLRLPDSAHCHNLSPDRGILFRALTQWAERLAGSTPR
jgi:hypothetical protein